MIFHTFDNGICSTCGEQLDYLIDNKLRDITLIGPKLPVDEAQGTFQLSLNVLVTA